MLTENIQIEQLQRWWKHYGNYVVAFALMIALIFGLVKWLEQRNDSILKDSSILYSQALNGFLSGDENAFKANANKLIEDYSGTIYADFSHFLMAKHEFDHQSVEQTKIHLKAVVSSGTNNMIRDIAKIRLARLYLNENLEADAIKLLNTIADPDFKFIVQDILGDLYLKKKEYKRAKEAYNQSLSLQKSNSKEFEMVIKMKLNSIPQEF